ncbi:hypothetical protein R6Q59_029511 [Mikania micrantha]
MMIHVKRHKSKRFESEKRDGDLKRRKKYDDDEDSIKSNDSDDKYVEDGGDLDEEETATEKLKRLGYASVEKMRAMLRRVEEDDDDETDADSLVARMLQAQQLQQSGRLRRLIASRVQNPKTTEGFRFIAKHNQSVTAVALSEDDVKVYSASKDGCIVQCDVDNGKIQTYGSKDQPKNHVLALAVSSDGRYLASGGFDRHVHLYDTRTRDHIQDFPGHKGPISCLSFREGTSELFSGSYDRTIKIWNADDRSYITTLFGHQSDVLTIDCLRKERLLTVGRDRTMHLWKVPEEAQLVFRSHASSLECCCFINNDEFLSGSDDGSIQHWSVLRKKPLQILKNAHSISTSNTLDNKQNDGSSNDRKETLGPSVCSWVSSVAVCRGSDLAASGAGNGVVRLWEIKNDVEGLQPLFELPLVGYINSLAFAKSGKFLVAGVGKEPRLGRWGTLPAARQGVALQLLQAS